MRKLERYAIEIALTFVSLMVARALFADPEIFRRGASSYMTMQKIGTDQHEWAVLCLIAGGAKLTGLTLRFGGMCPRLSMIMRTLGLMASGFLWCVFGVSFLDAPGFSVGAWPFLLLSASAIWCLGRNPYP